METPLSRKYFVILNPEAGRGRGAKIREKIEAELQRHNLSFEISETSFKGHAEKLAEEAPEEFDVIVAAGGDGTFNEVANGLMRNPRTMGLIPTGSGNDFARAMNIPFNYKKAIHVLAQSVEKTIDIGWVNGRYFPNGLGIGFDALVVHESNQVKRLRGILIYLFSVLKSVFFYSSPRMTLRLDNGKIIDGKIFMLTIGNGISLGGGFMLTPNAKNNDGLFDVCVIHYLTKPQIFWHLPKVFWGGHVKMKQVEMHRVKEIAVSAHEPIGAHVDGELIGMENREFQVKIFPEALRVIGGIPRA
ncbi:diacylglycerol kinase [bacterium BMS3Bbin03]|nr:diacylglycerol kinase [bacterium BMS3Bbin03]